MVVETGSVEVVVVGIDVVTIGTVDDVVGCTVVVVGVIVVVLAVDVVEDETIDVVTGSTVVVVG